jgi:hypothetical protein
MEALLKKILKNGLSDAQISGFTWSDMGENLQIEFILPDDSKLKILFVWTTSLSIHMDFGKYFGMPLIFNTVFKQNANNGWDINIVLGACPEGGIEFKCNSMELFAE